MSEQAIDDVERERIARRRRHAKRYWAAGIAIAAIGTALRLVGIRASGELDLALGFFLLALGNYELGWADGREAGMSR